MIERAVAGLVAATIIALAAHRLGWLTPGGALSAIVAGTLTTAAGWTWGALLILFFVSSSLLSRTGVEIKEGRTSPIIDKRGPRDALQVGANGGVYTLAAVLSLVAPWPGWQAAGAGALAAAAADTWGTELGTLRSAWARKITTFERVPAGTSGAVSMVGTAATLAGAALIGAGAWLLGWGAEIALAAVAGGLTGAMADSLVGAVAQGRRRCPLCQSLTERAVHSCGTATVHAEGIAWIDNDVVNIVAVTVGALVAVLMVS